MAASTFDRMLVCRVQLCLYTRSIALSKKMYRDVSLLLCTFTNNILNNLYFSERLIPLVQCDFPSQTHDAYQRFVHIHARRAHTHTKASPAYMHAHTRTPTLRPHTCIRTHAYQRYVHMHTHTHTNATSTCTPTHAYQRFIHICHARAHTHTNASPTRIRTHTHTNTSSTCTRTHAYQRFVHMHTYTRKHTNALFTCTTYFTAAMYQARYQATAAASLPDNINSTSTSSLALLETLQDRLVI